jgi:hypothetical protein
MSKLAHVIVGLDELSPAELEVVGQVIALRTGTVPASPQGVSPPKTGLFGRGKKKLSFSAALQKGCTLGVDPLKAEFIESDEGSRLMSAVAAASGPSKSGKSRNKEAADRLSAVTTAWNSVPVRLQRPFRATESRASGRTSSPPAAEVEYYPGSGQDYPVHSPVELSSGTEEEQFPPLSSHDSQAN